MIALAVEKPVGDTSGLRVAHLAEQGERGLVALVDKTVDLMEVEDTDGVVVDLVERGGGIPLPTTVVEDDESELGTAVGRVEVDEVGDADGLPRLVVDHHPHLTVGIDVVGGMGDIVVEHITGLGYV